MEKGYWINHVFEIKNPEKWDNYLKKWGVIVEEEAKKNSGNYKILGGGQPTMNQGEQLLFAVVVEFNSHQEAIDGVKDPRYQDALKELGEDPEDTVIRNAAIVGGM